MHGIFVLSFRRIDRAFESCGSSFSVIVVATRDRYNDQKKKKRFHWKTISRISIDRSFERNEGKDMRGRATKRNSGLRPAKWK